MRVAREADLDLKVSQNQVTPEFALVFYSSENGVSVTRHKFSGNTMLSGVIIDFEKVHDALSKAKLLNNHNSESSDLNDCFLPEHLLVDNKNMMVWYHPSCKNPMWLRLGGLSPIHLNPIWPALVFILDKKKIKLSIVALESDDRPTLNSPTYYAPLPNIFDDHHLCQGSALLPAKLTPANISKIEDTLYKSAFDGFKRNTAFTKLEASANPLKYLRELNASKRAINVKEELHCIGTLRETINMIISK